MPKKQIRLAKINPERCLTFVAKDGSPPTAWISITNCSDSRIAFKVKTSSPEGYQVHRHRGLIEEGTSVDIPVLLKKEGEKTASTDKFAVLIMKLGSENSLSKKVLDCLWSQAACAADPRVFMERRLTCGIVPVRDCDNKLPPCTPCTPCSPCTPCTPCTPCIPSNPCNPCNPCTPPCPDESENGIRAQPQRPCCDDDDISSLDCCDDPHRRLNERLDSLSTWYKIIIFALLFAFLCIVYVYLIANSNENDNCQYASLWSWKNR